MSESAELTRVSCANCGEVLDKAWVHLSPRPPCPSCGKSGIAIHAEIAEEIEIAESLDVVLKPQHTTRDWRRRWLELQREWGNLDQPIAMTMSGDAINAAHHLLQSFLVQAYHLKDALIRDPNSGVSKAVVESASRPSPGSAG
jgi:hypothetical protein